jgi:uncharacterized protein YjiS (DUF1127 family)
MAYTTYTNSRSANAMIGAQDYFAQMVSAVAGWKETKRTRDALNKLSDYQLEDIGLSRGDIEGIATARRR